VARAQTAEQRLGLRSTLVSFSLQPLGPGAPPPARLCAFGEHRIRFAHRHHDLLSSLTRGPRPPDNPPDSVLRTHIRILLAAAGTTGDLDAQADALTALFDADYIQARLDAGHTLDEQIRAWQSVATKLCGH